MFQILARQLTGDMVVRQFPTSPWIKVLYVVELQPTVLVMTPEGRMSWDRNQELTVR